MALIKAGHDVVIVDNLANAGPDVLQRIERIAEPLAPIPFFNMDCRDQHTMDHLFSREKFDGVLHFAGLKAVGESVAQPLNYYYTNLVSTMVIAKACVTHQVKRLIFSSSATVYGDNPSPLTEATRCQPTTNPYGETKAMSERILQDTVAAHPELSVAILRYFNPVGAHESGLLGESPIGIPYNLMPIILQVARGKRDVFHIFGDDYPTPDGTAIRDFIHVMDLAEGHVAALENLNEGCEIFNLGTGKGVSVLEMIRTFEEVNHIKITTEYDARRQGDLAVCFANVEKARQELNWQTKRNLHDMCRDAWRYGKR